MTDSDKFEVGRLARRLASGYYAFVVAHQVAVNPLSANALPPPQRLGPELIRFPTGKIKRKDGTYHSVHMLHFLDLLREDQSLQEEFLRAWAIGALLTLDDALKVHNHFDNAPVLELVYHLRNGVAHGNQFTINSSGKKRLARHPAHNRDAVVRSPEEIVFEITESTSGPVLFDFMGAGDVIDLLQSVECHLTR
ncbi:hypothetical protein [Acidimangrovimonas pyrenivorans]|uniref:Abi-like protein n=1 Tax=Acidimangrovimonas pyrenivorans TaxID=2030798 RepID=A0ABV7AK36_9RHOB